MYIYIYIYGYFPHKRAHKHTHTHVCVYIYTYTYTYIYIYINTYVYICIAFLSMETHPGWVRDPLSSLGQVDDTVILGGGTWRWSCVIWTLGLITKDQHGCIWLPRMAQNIKNMSWCESLSRVCLGFAPIALCSSSMKGEILNFRCLSANHVNPWSREFASTSHGRMSPLLSHPSHRQKKIRASQVSPNTRHQTHQSGKPSESINIHENPWSNPQGTPKAH